MEGRLLCAGQTKRSEHRRTQATESAVALQLVAVFTRLQARARLTSEQQGGHVALLAGEIWLEQCERGSKGVVPCRSERVVAAALGKRTRPRKGGPMGAARVSRLILTTFDQE